MSLDFDSINPAIGVEASPIGEKTGHMFSKVGIIGDIHGDRKKLDEILNAFPEIKKYIFIGDYIDRGTDSIRTLQFILNLVLAGVAVALRGNHDDIFISAILHKDPTALRTWFSQGGKGVMEEAIKLEKLDRNEYLHFDKKKVMDNEHLLKIYKLMIFNKWITEGGGEVLINDLCLKKKKLNPSNFKASHQTAFDKDKVLTKKYFRKKYVEYRDLNFKKQEIFDEWIFEKDGEKLIKQYCETNEPTLSSLKSNQLILERCIKIPLLIKLAQAAEMLLRIYHRENRSLFVHGGLEFKNGKPGSYNGKIGIKALHEMQTNSVSGKLKFKDTLKKSPIWPSKNEWHKQICSSDENISPQEKLRSLLNKEYEVDRIIHSHTPGSKLRTYLNKLIYCIDLGMCDRYPKSKGGMLIFEENKILFYDHSKYNPDAEKQEVQIIEEF